MEHFRFKETIGFLVFVLMFLRTFQCRKRLGTRSSVVVIRRFYIFDNSVEISKGCNVLSLGKQRILGSQNMCVSEKKFASCCCC